MPGPMKSIPVPGGRPDGRPRPPGIPPFVTFWRALLGYVAAVSSAASSCFPLLDLGRALRGETPAFLRPEMPFIDCICRFLTFEFGAILAALGFASLWILPMYVIGMVLARLSGMRRWIYFVTLGTVLAIALPYVARASRMPLSALGIQVVDLRLAVVSMPVGVIGGVVCWLVLLATYRDFSKQPGDSRTVYARFANLPDVCIDMLDKRSDP